jgi:excisionase family DNA binding protein
MAVDWFAPHPPRFRRCVQSAAPGESDDDRAHFITARNSIALPVAVDWFAPRGFEEHCAAVPFLTERSTSGWERPNWARARKKLLANQQSVAILFSTEHGEFFSTARPHAATKLNQRKSRGFNMDKHVLFHSKADAARLIGVSERMLHALISKKQLAIKRVGRRVLISDAELLKFAQRKTQ